ncbi:S41 family peptidase [candidate division KSB1 bacterium]|nr:S41 family peptidase [candidate division KSB1 bacterium]
MKRKQQSLTMIVLICAVFAFGGWVSHYVEASAPDFYYEVIQNTGIFGRIYEEISMGYVEQIDPEKFIRAGINGMLDQLDPYTVFIEKDDTAELNIMTKGKYNGLGMRIAKRGDWPLVIEPPFPNSPAQRAKIKEGDYIVEIDGESTKPLSVSETANRLRGEVGTEVTIKIKREGESTLLEFKLTRAEIKVEDISYKKIVQDSIGYVKLTHFSKDAGKEIFTAIKELKSQGMKSLILDLRNNPGGLLEAAVAVTDNLVDKGKLIVSTKGRTEAANQQYLARHDPILGDMPLIILVNSTSASASEIVSGAIQDLDRGVIIGTRTYGKGLVQTLVSVGKGAALKMTTAKYYIPSGRLIQKLDVFKNAKEKVFRAIVDSSFDSIIETEIADTANEVKPAVFTTSGGRSVYGNGGITPDIVIEEPKYDRYMSELEMKSMLFNFSVKYAAKHHDLSMDFVVDDHLLNEFRKYLEDAKFDYKPNTLISLEKFEKEAREANIFESVNDQTQKIREAIAGEKNKCFGKHSDFIKRRLKEEISAKMWGTDAEIEASFSTDRALQKALGLLSDSSGYYAILHPASKSGD